MIRYRPLESLSKKLELYRKAVQHLERNPKTSFREAGLLFGVSRDLLRLAWAETNPPRRRGRKKGVAQPRPGGRRKAVAVGGTAVADGL